MKILLGDLNLKIYIMKNIFKQNTEIHIFIVKVVAMHLEYIGGMLLVLVSKCMSFKFTFELMVLRTFRSKHNRTCIMSLGLALSDNLMNYQ